MFLISNFSWPSWMTKSTTESKRYYYTDQQLFEQSLDVYKPILPRDEETKSLEEQELPITLLVVGSGWVGHRALIYAQTSWWNSSGPQTVATSLEQTCVCIRHRGAFCVLPSSATLVSYGIILVAVLWALCPRQEYAVVITASFALIVVLLKVGARGSASLEDMLEDVAQAVKWIDSHPELLRLNNNGDSTVVETETEKENNQSSQPSTRMPQVQLLLTSSCSSSNDEYDNKDDDDEGSSTNSRGTTSEEEEDEEDDHMHQSNSHHHYPKDNNHHMTRPPFVFGGYSSGGHVATTLLQRPDLFAKYNLAPPEDLFHAILLISGVLAVRPETVQLDNHTTIATLNGPTWLTNSVLQLVWGSQYAFHNNSSDNNKLPSPIAQLNPPRLPHVVMGCQNELPFGLDWLEVYFCPREYCRMVEHTTQQPARYVEIPNTNHWFILSSSGLKEALQQEIPPLLSSSSTNNQRIK